MEQFRVVHLQKHTCDLSSKIRLRLVDKRIQTFTDHVLLHLRSSRGKSTCSKSSLGHHGLRRSLLLRWWWATSVTSLLVELHLLSTRSSAWHTTWSTTSSPAATTLLGHDTTVWHGITTTLLSHHGVWSLTTSTTSSRAHHLWHGHWVSWLHGTTWSWSLHVHWHTWVSHWTTHRTTHHSWLSWAAWSSSAVGMLGFKLCPTDISSLGKSNEDGLVGNDLAVHFVNSSGSFFRSGEADESESTRSAILHVLHDTGRSDGTHGSELVSELIVSNSVVKVLDVKIDALELGDTVHLFGFVLGSQFTFTLGLLLCTANEKFLVDFLSVNGSGELLAVQSFNGSNSRFVVKKVNKTESESLVGLNLSRGLRFFLGFLFWRFFVLLVFTFFLAFFLLLDNGLLARRLASSTSNSSTENLTELGKFLVESLVIPLQWDLLDVTVGPVVLSWSLVASNKVSNLDFLSIDQHTIELVNGSIGSFSSLVVDVTVSLGVSRFTVSDNLTGKNVSEKAESIIKLLVVDRDVEVLDKDISNSRATKSGITLTPHNTAGPVLDHGEVHGVEGTFSIAQLMVVNVSISERATSDSVTANTDGGNWSNSIEDLEQKTFIDIGSNVTDVKGRRVESSWAFSSRSSHLRGWGRGFRRSLCRGFFCGSRHDSSWN
mmetsp:Transcript_33748/g.81826  ORF Transcript_33748/g.81826 Transcript_33748/m.81826 type:complete len:657 (-) Transcript_33748:516-2486(-)